MLGAAAFAVIMASSAVSTPICALHERRDHFGSITVTLVYAVCALGVIAWQARAAGRSSRGRSG